ncbi:hypothetical protein LEP1GSC151_1798 [Leptospira interrogans serovar Grippotyphosa str. LT2186]|uniref:Uncharacterized protein n=4 Tax=Leptospira interrogans TaxID=173 RepID=M3H800_LEPIR|nr:hypothetical protein LEP1GSC027_4322 [Leptospira interrogans str. 2002000624]EKQ47721.1 hypothetical protein LEP1GSC026_4232 [Leptospira interrogans str. 2002000623]EKR25294.1 hypothetical protein LEP1GSC087_0924 [Leptospira interrogans serovar Bataviae str. L1111]EKR81640.1 hypothetical protein LEP1GSC099_1073 [Leptospira interrogans str. UI 08452]EMG08840.1 hypothetical protein LEP1GSC151_1798 [Leptospira interrogans serovar Grippotyphosa str. LT2186]EMM83759.1 hypothetical protein LEP1GS
MLLRQNGAPSGLEKRGLDAKHLPQNKKTNRDYKNWKSQTF